MRFFVLFSVLCSSLIPSVLTLGYSNGSLPIIDLGYEIYQATVYNDTGHFYEFSNIRYAAPPMGDFRFREPQVPATNRSAVQTGSVGRVCPQSIPQWIFEGLAFVTNYSQGLPFNTSSYVGLPISVTTLPQDAQTTEDCLFLDVVVPEKFLHTAGNSTRNGTKAPVLVWIHGGGYATGSKSDYGIPAEIAADNSDIIFVAINYRLGALGWSSGSFFEAENGVSNAGLYDQRFALEWVQQNIASFGGDPDQVTVIGESAGAGSILLQITAYGGLKGPVPFNRAILQSPALFPFRSASFQEQTFQDLLTLLNVSTLTQARSLPSSALITANIQQQAASPYGEFTYGPVTDGVFVPDFPGRLLLNHRFDSSVSIMPAHNADEAPLFTDPSITNNTAFNTFVRSLFPTMTDKLSAYVADVLYPPVFNGSQPYTNNLERAILLNSEILITCNTFYLDTAFHNETYAYLFDVPPGTHGEDLTYTFYTGPFGVTDNSLSFNSTVAEVLQDYVTSFARSGKPATEVPGVSTFGKYGPNAQVLELSNAGIGIVRDPAANERCRWWQLGLGWYY